MGSVIQTLPSEKGMGLTPPTEKLLTAWPAITDRAGVGQSVGMEFQITITESEEE